MKSFMVNKEELVGMITTGEIFSDGEYVNLPDDVEARTITTGFSVSEYREDGMIERVVFYPVKVDMESWTTNEDEVLEEIKKDYRPELGWQSNNW